ncbi:TPA: ClbS/DfsB family four-helix bundle protein [Klebsiella oxytoca]|nr:ClbS/DfsB family four-helix bundle protein [Klebsiella oxytoca]
MAVPQTKAELLTAIEKEFGKLIGYINVIPSGLATVKSMEGHAKGTEMSVHDLVAYLLGWNKLVVKWLTNDENGLIIDFPETGYKWNQLGLLAQKFYCDYSELTYQSLISALQTEKDKIVTFINKRTDEELYGKPWYGKWSMGRMISFNTSSPYANANGRLRKWAKNNSLSLTRQ